MAEPLELGKTEPRASGASPSSATSTRLDQLPLEQRGRYATPADMLDVELGRGGMGRVLRLIDTHLGREVALKELLQEHHPLRASEGPVLAMHFVREAQVLARLDHPCIVAVYELGRKEDGTPYYSMRRVRGRPLGELLDACASLEERLALFPHYLDVVHALAFAHSRGVVHRDLKPDNVMVGEFGETQVLDWGLALVDGDDPTSGVSGGTPLFMSPEQAKAQVVDARTDVWSLGVMLFQVLTGKLPFGGANVADLLTEVISGEIPRAKDLEPHAPAALVEVLERALERDGGKRFAHAGELAQALEAAQRARRPRPIARWVGVTALALAAVGLGAWALSLHQALTHQELRAGLALADAQRQAGRAEAEAAVLALRGRDVGAARAKALAVLAAGDEPLARGVWMLAEERGAPRRLWTVTTEAGCSALAVASDTVACATLSGVALFSAADGSAAGVLSTGPRGWQHAVVALEGGGLASGGDDRVLRTWELAGRTAVREEPSFAAGITALAEARGGLLVGLRSGEVLRLDGEERHPALKLPGQVRALAASGASLAASSSGRLVLQLEGRAPVTLDRTAGALAFLSPQTLAAGIERSAVLFEGGAPGLTVTGHRHDVSAVASLGGRLVTGSRDGTVRWWFQDGALDGQLSGLGDGVQALAVVPGAEPHLVVATRARTVEAYALPPAPRPLPEDGVPTAHALSAQGFLLSGLRDGRVRKVDLATHEVSWLEAAHEGAVRALAPVPGPEAPEALRLLTGGDDGKVLAQRWNGEVVTLAAARAKVTALAVSVPAGRAAWAFDDGTWVLYSLEAMKEVTRGQGAVARALAFSPDGRALAMGREDKRAGLVSADEGQETGELGPLDGAVTALAWLSGQQLIVAASDGEVGQWSVPSQRRELRWLSARHRVGALAVSPSGKAIAAGSDDGTVSLFTPGEPVPEALVPADLGDALAVAFDDDDTLLAVGTERVVHRLSLAPPR